MKRKTNVTSRYVRVAFSFFIVLLMAVLSAPIHSNAQEIAESDWLAITIYGGNVSVKAFSDDTKIISIDVVNPDNAIAHFESQGTWITLPYDAIQQNGHYSIEVQMVDKESGEIVDRVAGDFTVMNGSVVQKETENQSSGWTVPRLGQMLKGLARSVTGLLVSEAHAADLTASSIVNPQVNFDETDGGFNPDWVIGADGDGATSAPGCGGSTTGFAIFDNSANSCRKAFELIDSGNILNTFIADAAGNLHFANDGMFFNRTSKRLGIGTTAPTHMVDVVGNSRIRIRESTLATADTLDIRTDGTALDIEAINDNLWIHAGPTKDIFLQPYSTNRNVGIGTTAPTEKLHVRRYGLNTVGDGLSKLTLLSAYNTSNLAGDYSDVGFALKNERANFQWNFRTSQPTAAFQATKEGTGGAEFTLNNPTLDYRNVSITMGNGAICTSTGQWLNASSRDYKENIQGITGEEALDALKKLNPVKYNFKRDESKELNLGFIAEDVPDIVATGDRRTISPIEMVAVLTKAVQEQQKVMQEQQELIRMLSEKVDELAKK